MQNLPPHLTEEELADICKPLTSGFAQVRYLSSLGLHVLRKPNGRPLVLRSHFETVLSAGAPTRQTGTATGPNWTTTPNSRPR
jgi:hypothetical protein